jgi:hypothetical protein
VGGVVYLIIRNRRGGGGAQPDADDGTQPGAPDAATETP